MNCFNHIDQAAVATCRWCQRTLCRACARETTKGIACGEECEANLLRWVGNQETMGEATAKLLRAKGNRSTLRIYGERFFAAILILSVFAWVVFLGVAIGRATK